MPQKVTCSGKVVDDNSKPVAGVKVTLYQFVSDDIGQEVKQASAEEQIIGPDGAFSFIEQTQTDGRYHTCILVAAKEGFAIGWDRWPMQEDKVTVLPMGKPYTMSGLVVDEGGKPVEGAEVRISTLAMEWPQTGIQGRRYLSGSEKFDLLTTTTSASGAFKFVNMPAGALPEFIVEKAGKASVRTANPGISSSGYNFGQWTVQSKDIRIVLPAEAKIEGKVIEKDSDKGVGGVKLMCKVEDGGRMYRAKPVISHDDGSFSFDGLEARRYSVAETPSPREPAKWVVKPATVTITAGQTSSGIVLEASKGGILEVTVLDNQKKPIEGVRVYVRAQDDTQGQSSITNADGIAGFRLAAGECTVQTAQKEGYLSSRNPQIVTIEDGKTAKGSIELQGIPKITGVVRGPSGRAVAGASVRILPGGRKAAISDKDGRFEIPWNPQEQEWGLGRGQRQKPVILARQTEQNLAAVVDIDENTKAADINMLPAVILSGKVADTNGNPIAGAKVNVMLRMTNLGAPIEDTGVTTDQNGRYELEAVPECRYDIFVEAKGYGRGSSSADGYEAVNQKVEVRSLALKTANMSISGIVIDANDKPMANMELNVSGTEQPYRRGVTDGEGKFILDKLCEGQVWVSAMGRSNGVDGTRFYGNVRTEAGATDIKIVVNAAHLRAKIASFTVNQASCRLEVLVRDENRSPVSGTRIIALSKAKESYARQSATGITDSNGLAIIRVPPGEYELRPITEGVSPIINFGTATVEEGKTTRVEGKLKSVPKLSGIVRDPNDRPVSRVSLRIGSRPETMVISDNQGRFKMVLSNEPYFISETAPVLIAQDLKRNLAAVIEVDVNARNIDVNLAPAVVVFGKVVDLNNNPIENANVAVHLSPYNYGIGDSRIITDRNGEYQIRAIPRGQTYKISAKAEGHGSSYAEFDTETVTADRLEIDPLKLKTANLSISGKVHDVNDKPVPGARVNVEGRGQQHSEGSRQRARQICRQKIVPRTGTCLCLGR